MEIQQRSLHYSKRFRRNNLPLVARAGAILAALCLFLAAPILHASEVSLSDAVKQFAGSNKSMRIAVFDFANTDGTRTRFDEFIADTLVTELSKYPVTLLERKKLEVLLGEQALSQTGVIDSDKALKLGTMLPVDAVVSGSYTEIGNRLVINGRFIHVVTGEILFAFFSAIDAGSGAGDAKAKAAEDPKIICERKRETVRKALYNLQDQESVRNALDVVLAIPFDNDCGAVHYDAMNIFVRHKIFDSRYRAFLIKTLRQIETPSDDNRANEILRFFAADGTVDQEEWAAGIATLKKMRMYALHLPLRPLLNAAHEKSELVLERVDEVMRLTAAKEVGRPVPIEPLTMFYGVMNSLEVHSGRGSITPAIAVFKKHEEKLSLHRGRPLALRAQAPDGVRACPGNQGSGSRDAIRRLGSEAQGS